MVSALDPRASGPGWSRGQCVVFLDKTLTFTLPLKNKQVPANCWGNLTNCGGVTCGRLATRPGGVEILLAASCCKNWINSCSFTHSPFKVYIHIFDLSFLFVRYHSRPAHSFLWYLSPLKTLRWIVWRNFKGTIIKWLVIILLILIIFLFVYSVPVSTYSES